MKKYILLLALIATVTVGCGKADKDNDDTVTTESETVIDESDDDEYDDELDEEYEEETELNTEKKTESNNDATEPENTDTSEESNVSFEESNTYNELRGLAENAGFDISYSDGVVVFRTYITDDTIDYINEKNEDYLSKWDDNCGLYEEFCSEALRTVRNGNDGNVNVALEVVGRSDGAVYFKNENGVSTYNAYEM